MSSATSDKPSPKPPVNKPVPDAPEHVLLVPYPKIVFLYPTFLLAVISAIWMCFLKAPLDSNNHVAAGIGALFLGVFAINLVILAFDFPRTTSLTLFFFAAAVVMGLVLLFTFQPDFWPSIKDFVKHFHPMANATFYWTIAAIPVRDVPGGGDRCPLRLLGGPRQRASAPPRLLANLERLSAPNLRMEKEINDIFEYLLLRSGRLIIYTSNDRQPIVLDNVPFIDRKEQAVNRILGAVQVRRENPK